MPGALFASGLRAKNLHAFLFYFQPSTRPVHLRNNIRGGVHVIVLHVMKHSQSLCHITAFKGGGEPLFIVRIKWNTQMHFLGTHLIHIVAYRPVAKQWLCKQRPFLSNGSVNTFPLLCSRSLVMQQLDYNIGNQKFSMWFMPRCYKQGIKLSLQLSSVREASKGEPECVKLKNLRC
jgi:hypothetical protein